MPKRASAKTGPEFILDHRAPGSLYRQLYERVRAAILQGQLEPGARLPSSRALASELGVARNTVALAYELLLLEGYIEGRVGSGTRVASLRRDRVNLTPDPRRIARPAALGRRSRILASAATLNSLRVDRTSGEASVFRVGEPDISEFPYATWANLLARHARHSLPVAARYQDPQGYGPLREAIAAHIGVTRGVRCAKEQIILTAGAQGALDLIARVLLDPGDHVWAEDPGYAGAHGALLAAGARITPVPVDREGLEVVAGRALAPAARLAVVTPSHQFPTGVTMSLSRRLALLEWAEEAGVWIVEDDYDSEFRYSGRPLEALQGLDRAGRVLYVGTFSKALFPALRLGYLVAPSELLDGLLATRRFIDTHPPLLEQLALADFLTQGHYARHLRRMRHLYRERRDALVEALNHDLGHLLEIAVPEAGLHLAAWLRPEAHPHALAALESVTSPQTLRAASSNPAAPPRVGLLFGFACAAPDDLRTGVRSLAAALPPPLSRRQREAGD